MCKVTRTCSLASRSCHGLFPLTQNCLLIQSSLAIAKNETIVFADLVELFRGLYYVTGVTVETRIDCDASSDKIDEETLTKVITAVAKTVRKHEPTIAPLVQQYRQTSMKSRQSHFKHQIQEHHRTWLTGHCPERLLSYCAELLTDCALSDVDVAHASVGHSILLYCRVTTFEALSDLQQMIDSGQMSQLFSDMYTANLGLMARIYRWFAGRTITARVSISQEEYSRVFELLTGKYHFDENLFLCFAFICLLIDMYCDHKPVIS